MDDFDVGGAGAPLVDDAARGALVIGPLADVLAPPHPATSRATAAERTAAGRTGRFMTATLNKADPTPGQPTVKLSLTGLA